MRHLKITSFVYLLGVFLCINLYSQADLPTEDKFIQFIQTNGVAKAIEKFRKIKENNPDAIIFEERRLNRLGYQYLAKGNIEDALQIFKLNIEAYPDAFNTYDSYAEALMDAGDIDEAIRFYKKSVKLNPDNINGSRYITVLENYTKHEFMVPLRDGVKLYTQVYSPRDTSQTYPIMIYRTPYSVRNYGPTRYRNQLGPNDQYPAEGFIFVYQDVRGQYMSEGNFIVMKPYVAQKSGPQDTDESSDTYDTIEWLLSTIKNHNGRVGMWGISYPGWQTVLGMVDAHPALKASSPQASPSDMWIGDDFHHNGAFRLMYTFGWLVSTARSRTGPGTERPPRFEYGTPDGYQFFLDLGPISNIDKVYLKGSVPTWNEYMQHGDYDEYWHKQNILPHLKNIRHSILNVAGWFDAEDFYGPMSIYYTIEQKNPENKSTLVVGPWRHGGWARMDGDELGDIKFVEKTGQYFREEIEFPFFKYHLKEKGELNLSEAIVFETGSNRWRSYHAWPPNNVKKSNLYLNTGGKLSFFPQDNPAAADYDEYISDPFKPVPWSAEIRSNQGHLWMVEDQRFAARRPDVLVYQTDPLKEDIIIAGPIIANIFVSTSGTDADWIVKLIDVYPGNAPDNMGHYQMLVAGEVFRSKYRNSFEKPKPLIPGEVTKIEFDLRDKYHCFLKGHCIMVHIQSTWFPVIDRNPQKFVDIYRAQESDFQKATHRVYYSQKFPSHIKMNILNSE